MNRRFAVATALLIPALAFASCKDDGNSNPIGPDTPGLGAPTTRSGPGMDPTKFRAPQVSAAELALAVREDATANAVTTTTSSGDRAPHDPTVPGMRVICLDGNEFIPNPDVKGEASRFRTNHGCELNTLDGGAAFVITAQNQLRGKLLTAVQRLDFMYAGGEPINISGTLRLSIPIDECTAIPTAQTGGGVTNCPPGFRTDGIFEEIADIGSLGCNDGDANVGHLRGEDNPVCNVDYNGVDYPNWTAFETAFPGARIGRDFPTFVRIDRPNHYLIYRVNLR